MRYGVQSLWESWRRAECAPGRTQDERGPPKVMAVAQFCAPDIERTPFRVSRTMATLRETASRRGHNDISLFHDLDAQRVLYACEGRKARGVAQFADALEAHGAYAGNIVDSRLV